MSSSFRIGVDPLRREELCQKRFPQPRAVKNDTIDLAGIFRNDPAIYPDIRPFLRRRLEAQIRVGFHQIDGLTGKDNA